jgi:hypothetical protein
MSKYDPLIDLITQTNRVELSFEQIDSLVGGLPPSARRHQPWWANDQSHSHARQWMRAGYRARADLATGNAVFQRP